jgi:hypothetical protein
MKTIIAGAVSAGLMLALTTAARADHTSHYCNYDSYSETYPSATPRQLQNLRRYERGGYYEHDSTAVPFGSRVWWELKQGEGHE